ncbi:hypothetical protein KFL_004230010 [Klebsormidium nitens]|uniref:Uncharacterized protein n=1 Tax=Klebsormidium nitens TaxID=105231 RepID=A0A1Y1IJR2_KLENI|nr:hypothetical protein KFL_004230010 [Klebsormidium nitens]|eukprot:GAQ88378.1 hypothetical protein KFL_004230010 [Klebsormidium nitens]
MAPPPAVHRRSCCATVHPRAQKGAAHWTAVNVLFLLLMASPKFPLLPPASAQCPASTLQQCSTLTRHPANPNFPRECCYQGDFGFISGYSCCPIGRPKCCPPAGDEQFGECCKVEESCCFAPAGTYFGVATSAGNTCCDGACCTGGDQCILGCCSAAAGGVLVPGTGICCREGATVCNGQCCPKGSQCSNGVCVCDTTQNTLIDYGQIFQCCPGLNAKACTTTKTCCSAVGRCDVYGKCCEPGVDTFFPNINQCCPGVNSEYCFKRHANGAVFPDCCRHCVKGLAGSAYPGPDEFFCCDETQNTFLDNTCCPNDRVCGAKCCGAPGICQAYGNSIGPASFVCCDTTKNTLIPVSGLCCPGLNTVSCNGTCCAPGDGCKYVPFAFQSGVPEYQCCDTSVNTLVDRVGCCPGLGAIDCGGRCCAGTCSVNTLANGQQSFECCPRDNSELVTFPDSRSVCCPGVGVDSCLGQCCAAGESCTPSGCCAPGADPCGGRCCAVGETCTNSVCCDLSVNSYAGNGEGGQCCPGLQQSLCSVNGPCCPGLEGICYVPADEALPGPLCCDPAKATFSGDFDSGVGYYVGNCSSGTASVGEGDPHFVLKGVTGATEFTFDFHGASGQTYCMVTDTRLALNVRMFGLPPNATVLARPEEDDDLFNDGTWMGAIGILYLSPFGEQRNITVVMDSEADRAGRHPFVTAWERTTLDTVSPWKSADGLATIQRAAGRVNALSISVAGLLEMEVNTATEEFIIVDPPVHFLNVDIKRIATSGQVHGVGVDTLGLIGFALVEES